MQGGNYFGTVKLHGSDDGSSWTEITTMNEEGVNKLNSKSFDAVTFSMFKISMCCHVRTTYQHLTAIDFDVVEASATEGTLYSSCPIKSDASDALASAFTALSAEVAELRVRLDALTPSPPAIPPSAPPLPPSPSPPPPRPPSAPPLVPFKNNIKAMQASATFYVFDKVANKENRQGPWHEIMEQQGYFDVTAAGSPSWDKSMPCTAAPARCSCA